MSNRRNFLKNISLAFFGFGGLQENSKQVEEQGEVKFRIAHVTDQHVTSR